jgi:uncharacterized protein
MSKFTDRVVLITGASSGIGEGLAREFFSEGAHLVLLARRLDRLEALTHSLNPGLQKILCFECDVRDGNQLKHAVANTLDQLGKIDVVVANAGFGVVRNFEDLTVEDFRRQFETNVFGLIETVKCTLDALKKSKGRLALLGSVSGYVAQGGNSAYSMSKFAVRALAESLYHELKPSGISVTHIAPGFVVSEIRRTDNRGVWHPNFKETLPSFVQMPADKAARIIVRAIYRRRREKVITKLGNTLVWLERHFPRTLARIIDFFGVTAREEPH